MDPTLSFLLFLSAVKYTVLIRKSKEKPAKAKKVGTIAGLWFYPIKSTRGKALKEAECTQVGLGDKETQVQDRTWMVTTSAYEKINSKAEPSLNQVEFELGKTGLELSAPGMEKLFVPFNVAEQGKKTVRVLQFVEAVDCGDKVGEWFSRFLKKDGIRLVYSAPNMEKRKVQEGPKYWQCRARDFDLMGLADSTSFMLMTQKSLDDLNSRVENPVPCDVFRPSILVSGTEEAYEEDKWDEIYIGDAKLTNLMLSQRCTVVNMDPNTGVSSCDAQPLKTLMGYRKIEPTAPKKACFGIFLTLDRQGSIKVGDPVYATFKSANNL